MDAGIRGGQMDGIPGINPFDLLAVVAQLSVAFAGFGSIASGIGQQQARDDTRLDAARLINMLIVSLPTMTLALIPHAVALLRLPERMVWGVSAIIAVAVVLLFTPGVMARAARVSRYAGFSDWVVAVYLLLDLFAAASFLACAAGFPDYSPAAGAMSWGWWRCR